MSLSGQSPSSILILSFIEPNELAIASYRHLTLTQDTVNLPNVANLFWTHADEERSHAIQFIQYLRMRGAENNDFFGDSPIKPKEGKFYWSSVDEVSRTQRQVL